MIKVRLLGAIAAIGIGAVASSAPVPAQAPLELFDAHLHYNQEPIRSIRSTRCLRFSSAMA